MKRLAMAAVAAAFFWSGNADGAPFLSINDFIIAIDVDAPSSLSDYPDAEPPFSVLDSDPSTKYLNFGETNTGFIVTPFAGSTTVRSMQFTTANDAVDRDPLNWKLYGTNSTILSVDNGTGSAEPWTLIAEADALLPAERITPGPVYQFTNSTAYASYRVLFPTVKNPAGANSMQIADVGLFESTDGMGFSVLGIADDIRAFQLPQLQSRYPVGERPQMVLDDPTGLSPFAAPQSSYPGAEGPGNVVDGTNNKYLNVGDLNTGFIVTPAGGASVLKSFQLTTANDAVDRDPASYELWGTNSPIVSGDNSRGLDEPWTLISSGALALPADRNTLAPLAPVANTLSYSSYKMLFPTLKGPDLTLMQIAEASFFASTDASTADLLNPGDVIKAIDTDPTTTTGLQTKHLNFGEENSGVIITPAAGAKVLTGFQITTANDAEVRDPASYKLYGTNDTIVSADNSLGNLESWTLISEGALTLPTERMTADEIVAVSNTTSYKSYRIVFPTLKDAVAANSMQIAGLQFFDDSVGVDVDLDNDDDVDGNDLLLIQRTNPSLIDEWKAAFGTAAAAVSSVPEPSAALLALSALSFLARRQRRAG
jgi:hypothetical protein